MRIRVTAFVLVSAMLYECTPSESRPSDHEIRVIDEYKENDQPLPPAGPGDWLFEHEETGQTFQQYLQYKPVRPASDKKLIYLLPIGNFKPIELQLINDTKEYLEIFFNLPAVVMSSVDNSFIPESGKRNRGDGHTQLLTGNILNHLQKSIPTDGIVIMAITNEDLYPSDKWNFVFGQARTKQRVGVSSVYRYIDGVLDSRSYHICLERLIKTSSHEIGHMFSVQHCTHALCLMNGVNHLEEADSRPNRLCSECLKKLHWNLGFDILKREASLYDYFHSRKLDRDKTLAQEDMSVMDLSKQ
jgi:archaemetzincin